MLLHFFRVVTLMAVGIICLFFIEIDNKFEMMIGWVTGTAIAYILGYYILRAIKDKKKNQ